MSQGCRNEFSAPIIAYINFLEFVLFQHFKQSIARRCLEQEEHFYSINRWRLVRNLKGALECVGKL